MTVEQIYYGYSPAYLEHHGVKGMKWGVRRNQKYGTRHDIGHEGSTTKKSKIEKLDKKFISDKATSKAYKDVYNHMADKMNSEGIKELNSNPKWKGKNLNQDKKLNNMYMKEYTKIMERYLNEGNKKLVGSSASGRYSLKFTPSDSGFPSYEIVENEKIKHAINRHYIKAVTNELGQVDRVEIVNDIVEMSDLHHHGVKGMKWGVRKQQIKSGVSKAATIASETAKKKTVDSINKAKSGASYVKGTGSDVKTHLKTNFDRKRSTANTSKMSTKELEKAVNRRNLESRLGKEVSKANKLGRSPDALSRTTVKQRMDNRREYYRRATIPDKVLAQRVKRLELENRLNYMNQTERYQLFNTAKSYANKGMEYKKTYDKYSGIANKEYAQRYASLVGLRK